MPRKEKDRTDLTNTQNANIGPVFLTYKKGESIKEKVTYLTTKGEPYIEFDNEDGVSHKVRIIDKAFRYRCGKFMTLRTNFSKKNSRKLIALMSLMVIIDQQLLTTLVS